MENKEDYNVTNNIDDSAMNIYITKNKYDELRLTIYRLLLTYFGENENEKSSFDGYNTRYVIKPTTLRIIKKIHDGLETIYLNTENYKDTYKILDDRIINLYMKYDYLYNNIQEIIFELSEELKKAEPRDYIITGLSIKLHNCEQGLNRFIEEIGLLNKTKEEEQTKNPILRLVKVLKREN